ncbi:MAG: Ribosomal RNA small subunit methyltransferase I [Firmicutes bacterium]|nr:Ribosomal RNA small subunit methyltransferase I [Bacillota bacterium]
MTGTLYVCATPIGNLDDVSFRLLQTLKTVDLIAAEDTRHSLQLLRHFSIPTKVVSYHQHNSRAQSDYLLAELLAGKNIALISDAGTPGISDPGEQIIATCILRAIKVVVVPGPMAGVAALVLSGLPTGRFAFEGFLPRAEKERREALATLLTEERTMVFYEAPHRLRETVADMVRILGDRKCALARELTKMYEEVKRGTLHELLQEVETSAVRGECVLVVAGADKDAATLASAEQDGEALVAMFLAQGFSPAQASRHAAKMSKMPRPELYALALRLSKVTFGRS